MDSGPRSLRRGLVVHELGGDELVGDGEVACVKKLLVGPPE
jgi:hypothetical protein